MITLDGKNGILPRSNGRDFNLRSRILSQQKIKKAYMLLLSDCAARQHIASNVVASSTGRESVHYSLIAALLIVKKSKTVASPVKDDNTNMRGTQASNWYIY